MQRLELSGAVRLIYGSLGVKRLSSGSEMWWYGLDRAGSGEGQVAGTCESVNELSGSII